MLPSRFQAEVETVCDAGLESYLANKHKAYRQKRLEGGAVGAFVGILAVIGITYFFKDSCVKTSHAIFPVGAALVASGVDAIINADNLDEVHTEEFNDVCDKF